MFFPEENTGSGTKAKNPFWKHKKNNPFFKKMRSTVYMSFVF
jgi:hypothetical protein